VAQNRHAGSAPEFASQKTARHFLPVVMLHASLVAQNWHGSSITVCLAVFCERRQASRPLAEYLASRLHCSTERQPFLPRRRLRNIFCLRSCFTGGAEPACRFCATGAQPAWEFYHSLPRSLLRASSGFATACTVRPTDRAPARPIASPTHLVYQCL